MQGKEKIKNQAGSGAGKYRRQSRSDFLLEKLRSGESLGLRSELELTVLLSIPAILAQLSTVVMEYIDTSMVGQLGVDAASSVGLVSSTTWLFGSLCSAAGIGFSVQVAQEIGAGRERHARDIVKMSLVFSLIFNIILTAVGVMIAGDLPRFLGADESIAPGASVYFLVVMLFFPIRGILFLSGGLLQSSGNMKAPGLLNILDCVLDVVFNLFLIFPTRAVTLPITGVSVTLPGAGLGIVGAALGTGLAETVTTLLLMFELLYRSKMLRLRRGEGFHMEMAVITKAVRISVPVALQSAALSSAQVVSTKIVSPLGHVAIASHSFSITAEGLCYMPGYGISAAATAMVGQSYGAGRRITAKRLAWTATLLGMGMMALSGIFMYITAPQLIALLSPDAEIRTLSVIVLRIEAIAEPMFGASIVATGAMRGTGDTLIPTILNLISMWGIRLPMAAFLAPRWGLKGVWTAMCMELIVRGILFLIRLRGRGWLRDRK